MTKKLELDFGTVSIHENFLVSELREGILFDVESNRILLEIGTKEFNGSPFGYISNRVNSYAVNPMVYRESADYLNLKAIAVVTTNELGHRSAQVEQKFYNNKNCFSIFANFDDALTWIKKTIPN